MKNLWLVSSLVVIAVAGCGKKEDSSGPGAPQAPPATYQEAIQRMEKLTGNIDALMSSEKLDDVHKEAEVIKKLAEGMSALAKSMPAEHVAKVKSKSQELADMFSEIDEAADAGKKEETAKVLAKMKAAIADLKAMDHR